MNNTEDITSHINVELCPLCMRPGKSLDARDSGVPHCTCWGIANHMFVRTPDGDPEPHE